MYQTTCPETASARQFSVVIFGGEYGHRGRPDRSVPRQCPGMRGSTRAAAKRRGGSACGRGNLAAGGTRQGQCVAVACVRAGEAEAEIPPPPARARAVFCRHPRARTRPAHAWRVHCRPAMTQRCSLKTPPLRPACVSRLRGPAGGPGGRFVSAAFARGRPGWGRRAPADQAARLQLLE